MPGRTAPDVPVPVAGPVALQGPARDGDRGAGLVVDDEAGWAPARACVPMPAAYCRAAPVAGPSAAITPSFVWPPLPPELGVSQEVP